MKPRGRSANALDPFDPLGSGTAQSDADKPGLLVVGERDFRLGRAPGRPR